MHHHHDHFAAIVCHPLDLCPHAETGPATDPTLLLTIHRNKDCGCNLRKMNFPIFTLMKWVIFSIKYFCIDCTMVHTTLPSLNMEMIFTVAPLITTKTISSQKNMVRRTNFSFLMLYLIYFLQCNWRSVYRLNMNADLVTLCQQPKQKGTAWWEDILLWYYVCFNKLSLQQPYHVWYLNP